MDVLRPSLNEDRVSLLGESHFPHAFCRSRLGCRVPQELMAALDPEALLDLEVSLESWDSPDPREPL